MQCPRCQRAVDAKSRRCTWCGINVLPGQHLLAESGVVPIKPAQSEPESKARLATLGDRLIAMLLDCAIVLLSCALINVWTFMKWGIVFGTELRMTTASLLTGCTLSLLFVFLYVWILEASFGCTLGKAIVGIGVVNNSQRNAFSASAIRNLLRVVDCLGFYLIGTLVACCSKSRRRLGDLCAGTYVVEGSLSELARSVAVLGWLALLGAGGWALPQVSHMPKPVHAPRHLGGVVVAVGRADNSLYFRMQNRGVDLSLVNGVNGNPNDSTRRASDEQARKTSTLDIPETTGVIR